MIDPIVLASIRLPAHLGVTISATEKLRRSVPSIRQQSDGTTAFEGAVPPKRACLESRHAKKITSIHLPVHATPSAVGQFIISSGSSSVHSLFSQFQKSPYLPLDLFEPSFASFCPSVSVVDPELDDTAANEVPRWNQGLEFHVANEDALPEMNAAINHPHKPRHYLEEYRHVSTPIPFAPIDGPVALHHLPCRHIPTSCPTSCPTTCSHYPTSTTSLPNGSSSLRQYLYLPRSRSTAEACATAVRLNRLSSVFHPCHTTLISSDPNQPMNTELLSMIGGIATTTPPRLSGSQHIQRLSSFTSQCLAWDPTLIISDTFYTNTIDHIPMSVPTSVPCSNHVSDMSNMRWPFWCGDSDSITGSYSGPVYHFTGHSSLSSSYFDGLSLVADFATIEGLLPGVDTLTHTASGLPRRTIGQTLIRLWKVTLTMLCHFPDAFPAAGKFIEELIINIMSMLIITSRPTGLVSILKHLLHVLQIQESSGIDWLVICNL